VDEIILEKEFSLIAFDMLKQDYGWKMTRMELTGENGLLFLGFSWL
jgi:hypothetical protein